MISELGRLTWPDLEGRAGRSVLAVPLGSTEQHGPHLPLSTDTDIAVALVERVALARPDILTAPPLAYGASGEHAGFPGTLSIGQEALELVVVELCRSASGFAGVLLVSAHGGNAESLSRAVATLEMEGRAVRAWSPPATDPSDTHAGRAETSAILALSADAVRPERMAAGATARLPELWPALRSGGVAAVSPNGVLGDPRGASAEEGWELLSHWTDSLLAALAGWP